MPPDKKQPFKNPLTQASTSLPTSPLSSLDTATLPTTETVTKSPTEPPTVPETYTSTSTHRKRGEQAFERTHERITLWLDKGLKERFERLADAQGMAKSTLLNEAIADLLNKHQQR